MEPPDSLPVVLQFGPEFSLENAFDKLKTRPGVLWLDSSARGPDDLGRFSFLTSDPVDLISVNLGEANPWPRLRDWCRRLPINCRPDLPPFQGGIAGMVGYEAATWLERIPVPANDDLPTPAFSLGLYDWTLAFDHVANQGYLICQGLGSEGPDERLKRARDRAADVMRWLDDPAADTGKTHAPATTASSATTDLLQPTSVAELVDQFPTRYPDISSNFAPHEFSDKVNQVVHRIRSGESFQVNLAQRLTRRADCASDRLYKSLRKVNPAPFSGYYRGQDFVLMSSSPEGFLTVRDRTVQTRPIKGTVPRTGDAVQDEELANVLSQSEKDRAENIMIVDLMRNDLSRVCEDDSVVVQKLCQVERYQYVQHLVSVIEARLNANATIGDLLQSCFPGGSVTGAPKIQAMKTIAELEPNRRGPYCGTLGYISCSGAADFNILIRCIVETGGHWYFPVGGGVTARSQPIAEEEETWTKAMGILKAIQAALRDD